MDMWEPYINSVGGTLRRADDRIVFDRFHIMKHMGTRSTPCASRAQKGRIVRYPLVVSLSRSTVNGQAPL